MQKLHQGDIVWLNFDPQAGHEEGKRGPALIISGDSALALIKGLAVVCPITSHSHRFPTHVALDERTKTQGLILCEQCKPLDLRCFYFGISICAVRWGPRFHMTKLNRSPSQ